MKSKFEMRRNEGISRKFSIIKFFAAVVSLLVITWGLSLDKLYAQDAPLIDAEIVIIRLEGEGYVEIEITIRTTEIGGRGIADADVRLEDEGGSMILLLKEKHSPAENVKIYWKIEEARLGDILPNGSYKYVIDYGEEDVYEFPFEITDDFPKKPSIVWPLDGSTVSTWPFIVIWSGEFDGETLYPEYWLEFNTDDTFRGGSELNFEQVFGLQPNYYIAPPWLFGPGMNIEIILTATKTVFIQEGPNNYLYVLKSSHIDMDVTTK
jgi:hypothetical protein